MSSGLTSKSRKENYRVSDGLAPLAPKKVGRPKKRGFNFTKKNVQPEDDSDDEDFLTSTFPSNVSPSLSPLHNYGILWEGQKGELSGYDQGWEGHFDAQQT
mmetsp:Transcript_31035/g.65519  ORF Transcript_31035/g.65519 Transcript_31035/m.65519 type:complete len:101 (-) Transcript_31035:525-827(-)